MQPKPVDPQPVVNGEPKDHRDHLRTIQNSIFSIGDLFKDVGRDGPKSVKFPEKLVKVLEAKMQNIAMGKDPAFSDQLIRRTVAIFYGSFKDETFKRQMKENRKIEELILMFATTSTTALKKDPQLVGDGWKIELNNQIAQFVRILRDCLRNVSHVTPELTARLDMYTAKLAPQPSRDSVYDSTSPSSSRGGEPSSSGAGISGNITDMPLAKTVAALFGKSSQEAQQDINALKRTCTEKAALTDLKTCLKNINAGVDFPGCREDFETEAAYQTWRTAETMHLSQLMVIMVQFNPELAKSTPSDMLSSMQSSTGGRPESFYSTDRARDSHSPASRTGSISSRYSLAIGSSNNLDSVTDSIRDDDDEVPVGHHFTYIPPNPKKFYKRLVEISLQADLDAMATLPEDQEVSLGILSPRHLEVINECAMRWRIAQSYRVTCFIDIIRYMYEREEVPLECIPEGLQMINKAMQETELGRWPKADIEYIASVYGSVFEFFLGSLYQALDDLPKLKREDIAPLLSILEQVCDSGLLERINVDVSSRIDALADRVRIVAVHQYTEKSNEMNAQPGVNRALPLLFMTDEIEKRAKLLDKRFPQPLLGRLDLVSLVIESQIPLFLTDVENSRRRLWESSQNQPTPDVPIEDLFALFRRTKTVLGMHSAFCSSLPPPDFDLAGYFEPYVRQWLAGTDAKTHQWVQNAIAADKFEAEGPEGHSSSIIDLFDSLRSPINFLLDLEWPDEYQEARFFTALSKTVSKGVEFYCARMEELFMEDMFPRKIEQPQAQKQSAWIEKAKQTIQGEKKVEPFNFTAASCVKLNNIESARNLLDQMYNQMRADKIASVLQEHGPPVPDKSERERFLFTIKVIMAEGLVPLDTSPSSKLDSYVKITDQNAVTLAKTRTIYESNDPRWDQTIDLSVDTALWVMVSVRDHTLLGKHDTVGRAYLCLDPQRFGDFLAHDLWLDLDSQGRILTRVSMEGEKDDIQFYFGRAFRSLKRAETDMVRAFIDKMAPFISQCLSRNVLKTLIKAGVLGLDYNKALSSLDYNKALGNMTALYRALGSSSSEVQIPLPEAEKVQEKPSRRPEELTDVEIEQAILPVFDYFDANLQVLNSSLGDKTKEMVMTRVWKVILNVIESLLVPPLADTPSDMKPLSDKEVDIVFKWLKFLRDYFYANGEGPVPLETLQNQKYRDVVSIRLYYDWHTDALMEECVRMMQQQLRAAPSKKRAKTVYAQKNLGTIRDKKRQRRQEKEKEETNGSEMIMRILRMRPGTIDFIGQQMQIMSLQMQSEQEKRTRTTRRLNRPQQERPRSNADLPPMPTARP
ncbi:hypothetical protein K439DRAFT_1360906 [Ramaria rubella]|nr:hypothetical protein K439DRAFT_1360906 [Ramaria rubella]